MEDFRAVSSASIPYFNLSFWTNLEALARETLCLVSAELCQGVKNLEELPSFCGSSVRNPAQALWGVPSAVQRPCFCLAHLLFRI